ncbi:hypothetical protein ES703_21999 [subsurface metagenome]
MKISGSGRLSEMSIKDNIVVSGSVKMDGNIECQGFRSSGSTRGVGNLTVHGDVKSSGSFRILGALHGDGNAKFSGSTTIGEEIEIKGVLESSGSLRAGNKVEALQGMRFSGSTKVDDELNSEGTIEINGSITVRGDITGNNVFIGTQTSFDLKRIVKHLYKVFGNIFSTNDVEIINTFVQGDVKGRNVKIGRRTEITGKVYYVDTIEINARATLTHEPIQISEIAEDKLEK